VFRYPDAGIFFIAYEFCNCKKALTFIDKAQDSGYKAQDARLKYKTSFNASFKIAPLLIPAAYFLTLVP
jgi:hypothetical protein